MSSSFPRCFRLSLLAILLLSHFLVSAACAETPHLDAVEAQLRQLAPGSEGTVWKRTDGNLIAGHGVGGSHWLLQSPDCWGQGDCSSATGAQRLADAIRSDIAAALEWVDITTLVTYPDGMFQEAIVSGLKEALTHNPDITIRVLGGTPPVMGSVDTGLTETASNYMERLKADLGSSADNARIIVAGVETSWLYSWNHAKMVAVDGKTVITGGHNLWEGAYAGGPNPVSDVSMRLTGPAAESAHTFADLLWDFAETWSQDWWSRLFYVEVVKGEGFNSITRFPTPHEVSASQAEGDAPVLALGGLGFGMDVPGGTAGGLEPANDSKATCSRLHTDYVNNDAEYSVANPEEAGLRALIASATESVFISQQDLLAVCAPPVSNSCYDARLFDILADKLIREIPVKIIVSSPGAKQSLAAPYSNMDQMTDITDILIRKVRARADVDQTTAEEIICHSLQLAPIRIADNVDTWANGRGIANHAKVICVDDAAFYIGSKNLYPATLQDFGFIVEDSKAAADFKKEYLDVIWNASKHAAIVDFEEGVCNF